MKSGTVKHSSELEQLSSYFIDTVPRSSVGGGARPGEVSSPQGPVHCHNLPSHACPKWVRRQRSAWPRGPQSLPPTLNQNHLVSEGFYRCSFSFCPKSQAFTDPFHRRENKVPEKQNRPPGRQQRRQKQTWNPGALISRPWSPHTQSSQHQVLPSPHQAPSSAASLNVVPRPPGRFREMQPLLASGQLSQGSS